MVEAIAAEPVVQAALRARSGEGIRCARFGDCKAAATATVALLRQEGIPAKLVHGRFVSATGDAPGFEERTEWDHSWVEVSGDILDPTVDQFFSELDEDMILETPGVYYSHPRWDGDWLVSRYER